MLHTHPLISGPVEKTPRGIPGVLGLGDFRARAGDRIPTMNRNDYSSQRNFDKAVRAEIRAEARAAKAAYDAWIEEVPLFTMLLQLVL